MTAFDAAAVAAVEEQARIAIASALSVEELRTAQAGVLGKRGSLTALNATLRDVPVEVIF